MAKVDKEVWIKAPLDKIFDYVFHPNNMPEFWPSLVEINDLQTLPNGGYSAGWVYKMLGLRFEGKAEYTRITPNEFFVIETKGGIESTIVWTFRSREGKTRVTFTVDYKVPIPLLGKLGKVIITKMNDHEGDLIMANLQTRFLTASR
jgi:uncharacterized membrane protein